MAVPAAPDLSRSCHAWRMQVGHRIKQEKSGLEVAGQRRWPDSEASLYYGADGEGHPKMAGGKRHIKFADEGDAQQEPSGVSVETEGHRMSWQGDQLASTSSAALLGLTGRRLSIAGAQLGVGAAQQGRGAGAPGQEHLQMSGPGGILRGEKSVGDPLGAERSAAAAALGDAAGQGCRGAGVGAGGPGGTQGSSAPGATHGGGGGGESVHDTRSGSSGVQGDGAADGSGAAAGSPSGQQRPGSARMGPAGLLLPMSPLSPSGHGTGVSPRMAQRRLIAVHAAAGTEADAGTQAGSGSELTATGGAGASGHASASGQAGLGSRFEGGEAGRQSLGASGPGGMPGYASAQGVHEAGGLDTGGRVGGGLDLGGRVAGGLDLGGRAAGGLELGSGEVFDVVLGGSLDIGGREAGHPDLGGREAGGLAVGGRETGGPDLGGREAGEDAGLLSDDGSEDSYATLTEAEAALIPEQELQELVDEAEQARSRAVSARRSMQRQARQSEAAVASQQQLLDASFACLGVVQQQAANAGLAEMEQEQVLRMVAEQLIRGGMAPSLRPSDPSLLARGSQDGSVSVSRAPRGSLAGGASGEPSSATLASGQRTSLASMASLHRLRPLQEGDPEAAQELIEGYKRWQETAEPRENDLFAVLTASLAVDAALSATVAEAEDKSSVVQGSAGGQGSAEGAQLLLRPNMRRSLFCSEGSGSLMPQRSTLSLPDSVHSRQWRNASVNALPDTFEVEFSSSGSHSPGASFMQGRGSDPGVHVPGREHSRLSTDSRHSGLHAGPGPAGYLGAVAELDGGASLSLLGREGSSPQLGAGGAGEGAGASGDSAASPVQGGAPRVIRPSQSSTSEVAAAAAAAMRRAKQRMGQLSSLQQEPSASDAQALAASHANDSVYQALGKAGDAADALTTQQKLLHRVRQQLEVVQAQPWVMGALRRALTLYGRRSGDISALLQSAEGQSQSEEDQVRSSSSLFKMQGVPLAELVQRLPLARLLRQVTGTNKAAASELPWLGQLQLLKGLAAHSLALTEAATKKALALGAAGLLPLLPGGSRSAVPFDHIVTGTKAVFSMRQVRSKTRTRARLTCAPSARQVIDPLASGQQQAAGAGGHAPAPLVVFSVRSTTNVQVPMVLRQQHTRWWKKQWTRWWGHQQIHGLRGKGQGLPQHQQQLAAYYASQQGDMTGTWPAGVGVRAVQGLRMQRQQQLVPQLPRKGSLLEVAQQSMVQSLARGPGNGMGPVGAVTGHAFSSVSRLGPSLAMSAAVKPMTPDTLLLMYAHSQSDKVVSRGSASMSGAAGAGSRMVSHNSSSTRRACYLSEAHCTTGKQHKGHSDYKIRLPVAYE